ncbi:MAG: thiamine phosphate synthase [Phycisphaerales bacterium]|nr:thiamine phosphate synthase [Phycisphaerales bacterium]
MTAPRLIDANANRAREALRVMEDVARFGLDHQPLCRTLKNIRHDLAAALARLPEGLLIAHRDTPGDVGTAVSTPAEVRRSGLRDAAVAAGKRLSEALRAIEEGCKALAASCPGAAGAAAAVEQLRYRGYDAERTLALALGTGRGRQFRLCVLLTESLCAHHPWPEVARLAMDGGADCLQLREKSLTDRELLSRARRLVGLAKPRGVAVFVNDRPDVALLAGADGVHLGQTDMSVAEARRIFGFELLVGVSTTTIDQARAARGDGADLCGVGPMFATTTKASPGGRTDGSVAGPAFLREYLAADPPLPPHLAIGGIGLVNVGQVAAAGARGVAASAAVCSAADPLAAAAELAAALGPAPRPPHAGEGPRQG